MQMKSKSVSNPLVSIIVPVFKTERYLKKCLDSILNQTYKNIEIICVNDASTDNSLSIIKQYASKNANIKVITNEKNNGLYATRIIGSHAATGDYIMFVDSDDFISIDWVRLLVNDIVSNKSDIAMGNIVQVYNGKDYFIDNNGASLTFNKKPLIGKEIFDMLLKDASLNFSWHVMWNKIYTKKLWDTCYPHFLDTSVNLTMAEDIAFSVPLFYFAKKMSFVNVDAYFYSRNQEASTSVEINKNRIKKNIKDIASVFDYFEMFLRKFKIFDMYHLKFNEFRDRNFRTWCNLLRYRNLSKNKTFSKFICDEFHKKQLEYVESDGDDFYFYEVRTSWNNLGENAKTKICCDDTLIISFDLFDTLVCRPFTDPNDIFTFIEIKYKNYFDEIGLTNFSIKRKEAENYARNLVKTVNSRFEDCTLEEIYRAFIKMFNLPISTKKKLIEIEESTDIELCVPRDFAIELFNLASFLNKKIIITTDTYYNRGFIKKVLDKIGVHGYQRIYISCENRKLKRTGNLFKVIKSDFKKIPSQSILHIGDNWDSDCVAARAQGLTYLHLVKPYDSFTHKFPGQYPDTFYIGNSDYNQNFYSLYNYISQLPIKAIHGLVSNNLFDMPFVSWNTELKYNANFYGIGYYLLGSELLDVSNEILRTCFTHKYNKVIFFARDGYMPKKTFDILLENRNITSIKTEYFYISRRSILPFLISQKHDIQIIHDFISIGCHTPISLFKLLEKYFSCDESEFSKICKNNNVLTTKKFESELAFLKFVNIANKLLNFKMLSLEVSKILKVLKTKINKDTLIFDAGYSGRIHAALASILKCRLNVFFIHSNGFYSELFMKENGVNLYSYFDYSPKVSGAVREYFYSELAPSCIGYEVATNGEIAFVFDNQTFSQAEHYLIDEIHRGVIDFVTSYCSIFARYDFMFMFRNNEMSLPFERFLNCIPAKDMFCFRICTSEDMLFSNYNSGKLNSAWLNYLNYDNRCCSANANLSSKQRQMNNTSFLIDDTIVNSRQYKKANKLTRGLILFASDNRAFWNILKRKLEHH